jgi:fermentation-respiration switch protein FrsA (DUF1100 family)
LQDLTRAAENLQRLRESAQAIGRERRKSPPREGPALLQGLIVCGKCGRRIILTGWSLGTGPATEISKEYPDVAGLVLVSPYTALPDLIQFIPELWYVRPLPYRLLLHTRFDNLAKMNSVHVPVLLVVGSVDDLTVFSMATALFQKANEPKRLYVSPGASHANVWDVGTDQLIAEIRGFIQGLH